MNVHTTVQKRENREGTTAFLKFWSFATDVLGSYLQETREEIFIPIPPLSSSSRYIVCALSVVSCYANMTVKLPNFSETIEIYTYISIASNQIPPMFKMTTEATIRAFVSSPCFAIVGASSNPAKFGYMSIYLSVPFCYIYLTPYCYWLLFEICARPIFFTFCIVQ